MNMNPPLISIIIPTRNRIPFCISVIKSILSISDNRLELIVSDNSDSMDLKKFVENNITDRRLRYNYTNEAISSIDNFNAGMGLSTGEFVCFIGDDDGINPEIIEAASWAKRNNVEALSWKIKSSYLWPGTIMRSTLFTNVEGGKLTIYPFTGKIQKVNADKEIKKFLKGGGVNYLNFNLPKAYHGIIKRSTFEKIKAITGNYFSGLSPDIFSSIAIGLVIDYVYVIDYPLSIPGSCPVAEQTHNSKDVLLKPIEDAPHLRNISNYIWDEIVPPVYTGDTIQLETGITALKIMRRSDLISNLNVVRMIAFCLLAYPQIKNQIIYFGKNVLKAKYKSLIIGGILILISYLYFYIKILVERGPNRAMLILGFRHIYSEKEQNNIFTATATLVKFLELKNKKVTDYL
jgi:glycosyltransferase involved in cell wall biosynthesis